MEKSKNKRFSHRTQRRYKPDDKLISKYQRLDKIDFSGTMHISNKPTKTDMILVYSGDLVISGINVAKGAITVYQGKEPVCATIHYSAYTFNDSIVDLDYFKFFVKSPAFIETLKQQVKGGIKTEIKPKHLLPLEISIPDLSEQKRIVSVLLKNLKKTEELQKEIAVKYSIKELSPKQRNELIRKWLYLDSDIQTANELTRIKELDKKTEQIEAVTGKSVNGGIMPAYPFLVLSILSNVETLNRPLNQQMTSFGYCYEALIIIAFTKCGLKTDDQIGGAINFLSSFAFFLYANEIYEMSSVDFKDFLDKYEERISLPFKKDIFIKKLEDSRLLINPH